MLKQRRLIAGTTSLTLARHCADVVDRGSAGCVWACEHVMAPEGGLVLGNPFLVTEPPIEMTRVKPEMSALPLGHGNSPQY